MVCDIVVQEDQEMLILKCDAEVFAYVDRSYTAIACDILLLTVMLLASKILVLIFYYSLTLATWQ